MQAALGRPLHPALRAGLTSATVMAAGDVICQKIQARRISGPVDWRRTSRFSLVGLCIHGPFFLYGFKWLDTVIKGPASLKTALAKTSLGQVTLFPVYLGSCLLALQLLEGKSLEQSVEKVKALLIPTMIAGAVFWPAANLLNFMFVPSSGRVPYVNAAGLVWNTYLSLVNSQKAAAPLLKA